MRIHLILIGMLFSVFVSAQGIVTVNNNSDFSADYDDLQTAVDAVAEGTIILVSGSGTTYGSVVNIITINKQLAIYGPGYFLGANEEPWTQAHPLSAQVASIRFDAGSEGSLLAGVNVTSTTYIQTSDITIKNSKLSSVSSQNSVLPTGIVFEGNYLTGGGAFSLSIGNGGACVYRNNIIIQSAGNLSFSGNVNSGTTIIENNTLISGSSGNISLVAPNSIFRNNIFINTNSGGGIIISTSTNTIANNNMSTGTGIFDDFPNNLDNITPEEVFIDWESPSLYSPDYIYTLAADSPAIAYGSDGQDAGAFGGDTPYRLSGIPEIPHIYFLDVPTTGTTTDGVQMHIKARANN